MDVCFLVRVIHLCSGVKILSISKKYGEEKFVLECLSLLGSKKPPAADGYSVCSQRTYWKRELKHDTVFRFSKVLRLHAVLHDTAGAVSAERGRGPGYYSVIGRGPSFCFLGHITGLFYCLNLKILVPSNFNLFDC